ncbi:NineTeen Complex (NTC) component [Pseudocyphellaria aurata]|nr:NineTeen Complex (NTC) component [Pseudocyphellaria aurata]
MLFRFRAQQAASLGILDISRARRPKAITSITAIPVCEKWRGQVLKEISRKVSKIQEASLSDFQIRDLNDEINKLMREKHMWEAQIRGLGGPNYMRGGGRVLDDDGREIEGGGKGYRYFGRARTLPGVAELFAPKPASTAAGAASSLATRADLRKQVDASYYGYNLDEEDGRLLAYEKQKEDEAVRNLLADAEKHGGGEGGGGRGGGGKTGEGTSTWEPLPGDGGDGVGWRLPSLDEVSEELVERRRRRLLDSLG